MTASHDDGTAVAAAGAIALLFGRGCYDDEGGARWLQRTASVFVTSPLPAVRLSCLAQVAPQTLGPGPLQALRVLLDGRVLFEHRFTEGVGGVTVGVTVPTAGAVRELAVETTRVFIPADHGIADGRELGVSLSRWSSDDASTIVTLGPWVPADDPCDVCGSFADRLVGEARSLRESLVCRACGSTSRDRTYIAALGRCLGHEGPLPLWPRDPSCRILEASGMRAHPARLADRFFYVNTQFQHSLPAAEASSCWPYADLSKLPFRDDTFDVVMSSDVFEHVRLYLEALRESHRVLKPGGSILIQVPWSPLRPSSDVRVVVDGDVDRHVVRPEYHADEALVYRYYGADFLQELEDVGFDVRVQKDRRRAWLTPWNREYVIEGRKRGAVPA